jgi:HPr kinase/phosphorylase
MINLHASCVSVLGKGLLIIGPSGSGKSTLALQMMAYGALLVADDRTDVENQNGVLYAKSPPALMGMIEARGIGILRPKSFLPRCQLALVIDLGTPETQRLPPLRQTMIDTVALDLLFRPQADHLPAALMCYLNGARF